MNEIRQRFFALRNGLLADTLRKAGMDYKYIFGLQLPQLKAIADEFRPSSSEEATELARSLWADKDCREARLLACHIMPSAVMTKDEALVWCESLLTREEGDIIVFRLLRNLPFAHTLIGELDASKSPILRHTASSLKSFLNVGTHHGASATNDE